jgi:hypothetical protein
MRERPTNFIDYENFRLTKKYKEKYTGFCPVNITKILFLDIDGVLQPGWSQKRFDHINNGDLDKLYPKLFAQTGIDYSRYDIYDVSAVYYDWHKTAKTQLRRILDETNAKIVLSSAWRTKNLYKMKILFNIFNFNDYYIDNTIKTSSKEYDKLRKLPRYKNIYGDRSIQILEYLHKYDHINMYVAVDDLNLSDCLGDHFVYTGNVGYLNEKHADKCIEILTNPKYKR